MTNYTFTPIHHLPEETVASEGDFFVIDSDAKGSRRIDASLVVNPEGPEPQPEPTVRTEKWLLTADWQARNGQAVDVARQRAMMDDIEDHHPDCVFGVIAGDLVDTASTSGSGAQPQYGYPELFQDMDTRIPSIPRNRWLMLPGNHDRDGYGGGSWRDAWTYKTYRDMVGKEFFYVRKGNLTQIFMGDMQGSVSGEIPEFVVDWFDRVVQANKMNNIIVWLHQPVYGANPSGTGPRSPWVQIADDRIKEILRNAGGNVLFVGYGHVGGSFEDSLYTKFIDGIPHINFQMGIPSAVVGNRDLPYSIMTLENGSKAVLIRRWNATTHQYVAGKDITLTAKYEMVLGNDTLDYDGRNMSDPYLNVTRGEQVVYQSMAEYRDTVAPFSVAPFPAWVQKIILADDANDNCTVGQGLGTAYYLPGASSSLDDGGYSIIGPSYGLAGGVSYTREGESERNYSSIFTAWVRKYNADPDVIDLEEAIESRPSTAPNPGTNIRSGSLRVGTRTNQDFNSTSNDHGVVLRETGYVTAARDSFSAVWQRAGVGGPIHLFYSDTSVVGNISTNGTNLTLNSTSDETLKDDEGELTFEQARAVLDLVRFHIFRWNELSGDPGKLDEGVFAQELYKVYPKAVTVGGWVDKETGKSTQEGDEGAIYIPWSVEYSSLVTVIGRCVQAVMQRQDDILARLDALEAK